MMIEFLQIKNTAANSIARRGFEEAVTNIFFRFANLHGAAAVRQARCDLDARAILFGTTRLAIRLSNSVTRMLLEIQK